MSENYGNCSKQEKANVATRCVLQNGILLIVLDFVPTPTYFLYVSESIIFWDEKCQKEGESKTLSIKTN